MGYTMPNSEVYCASALKKADALIEELAERVRQLKGSPCESAALHAWAQRHPESPYSKFCYGLAASAQPIATEPKGIPDIDIYSGEFSR